MISSFCFSLNVNGGNYFSWRFWYVIYRPRSLRTGKKLCSRSWVRPEAEGRGLYSRKFRAKFEVLLQNNFCHSSLLKSLEIRLFYRKLNSRKRGNSLNVYSTEIVLNTATIRKVNLTGWNWLKFYGEGNTGLSDREYSAKLKATKQTITTTKHSTEFAYSDFPCHFKNNRDKLALTNRRWMCNKGKRLTITANF